MFLITVTTFILCSCSIVSAENGRLITLTHLPLNQAVYVGDTVILLCEAHAPPPAVRIMWGEFVTSQFGAIVSNNGAILAHPNAARYRIIHNTSTEFHLQISDVRLEDAGRYVCQDTLADPPDTFRGEAELIVLESEPVCDNTAPPSNNLLEGQTFTIECRMNYRGLHPPQMHWSGPLPFEAFSSPPNPTTVVSRIQYTVNRSMDLGRFQCKTNITNVPPQSNGVADNTPTWSHLFQTPQIYVFWGPKNMFETPIKAFYEEGDVLTCNCDAYPAANFLWQNMRTLELFNSRNFTVTTNLVGTNQTMRCQAQNLIAGFLYSLNIFINVQVAGPPKNTFATPIKTFYQQGDVITCYADAFPAANFSWQNMRTLEVFYSRNFTVSANLVSTNQTMRCEARNVFDSTIFTDNIFITVNVGASTFTQLPLNQAVYVGDTVILRCETFAPPPTVRIMWAEFVTNSGASIVSDNEYILNHPNAARYRIGHNTSTAFHLEIRDVRLEDAGRYLCQNTLGASPSVYRAEAQLIVLESEPVCNSSAPRNNVVLEGQTFTIECRMNYQGLHPPQMHWSGPLPFEVFASPPNPTTVVSGVQYTVNRSMDLGRFECKTNIIDVPPQSNGVADNTPTWSHLFQTPQIFVYWPPKNSFATPIKEFYQEGDVITCNTDSFPESFFAWQNMRTLEIFNSRNFTVTANLVGTNQTIRCQAQNFISGDLFTHNIFINVYVAAPPKNMSATPIKEFYQEGDVLTCNCDAYPAATFAWQNIRTLEIINARNFTVTANLVGTNQILRCQAQNLINGFLFSQNIFINLTVSDTTHAQLAVLPINFATYEGSTVEHICSVDVGSSVHRVQWREFAYNSNGNLISDGDNISPAHPHAARYELVRSNPHQFNLRIHNVTRADSGTYQCMDANAPTTVKYKHSAELIVFDGPQECTSTIPTPPTTALEGAYYSTECTINYGKSYIRPNMLWHGPVPFGQGRSITDTQAYNGMSLFAQSNFTGQHWTSRTYFNNDFLPVDKDMADNIPDFVDIYDTPRITVNWPPRHMEAGPVRPLNEYEVGDAIVCFANAFPAPTFSWKNLRTNEEFYNRVFVIPITWLGTTQVMLCESYNTINGVIFRAQHTMTVNVPAVFATSSLASTSTQSTRQSTRVSDTTSPATTTSTTQPTSVSDTTTTPNAANSLETSPTTPAIEPTTTSLQSTSTPALTTTAELTSSTTVNVATRITPISSPTTTISDNITDPVTHEPVLIPKKGFHGWSFVGGIILAVGIVAIVLVIWRWKKVRYIEQPYAEI